MDFDSKLNNKSRRDFLVYSASGMGIVGAGLAVTPLIDSMNPAADVLSLASIEVDLSSIEVGQAITIKWRGKPVFIRHRTDQEIKLARDVNVKELIHKQKDSERVQKAQWLIMVGICTHLGCIPNGQKNSDYKGDYNGWFCPCHGSHYDTSGRIRKGPAPLNLFVPKYTFASDTVVKIG